MSSCDEIPFDGLDSSLPQKPRKENSLIYKFALYETEFCYLLFATCLSIPKPQLSCSLCEGFLQSNLECVTVRRVYDKINIHLLWTFSRKQGHCIWHDHGNVAFLEALTSGANCRKRDWAVPFWGPFQAFQNWTGKNLLWIKKEDRKKQTNTNLNFRPKVHQICWDYY